MYKRQGLTLVNPLLGRALVWAGSRFLAYGLVGGIILLTLWIWLLGLILYFGMAWTVALTLRREPQLLSANATELDESEL